ncbi:acyltransferase family protein [Microbacterium sp. HMH0099]|uniref:acyltransferase family protein n=1 Tax=Microbacterium sp. HMH0099 TaxID=3414026 RepID=UPI003BF68C49
MTGPAAPVRLRWPDVARGGAMMLVVLAHTLQLLDAYGWSLGWLDTANTFLTAIRMPLFFTIAGMLATSALRRPWGRLWRTRLLLLVYVYVLWMAVRTVWFSFVPWPLSDLPPWASFLLLPVWPTTGLWFLYALVLYTVAAKALSRAPRWVSLGAAAALSVLAAYDLVPTGDNPIWRSIALYLLFFLLGVHGSDLWKALAARTRAWWAVPALLLVPAAFGVFTLVPSAGAGAARVLLSTVCVAACIVLASVLARVPGLSAPFAAVGRRTLPIYVMHTLLLAAVVAVVPVGVVPTPAAAIGLCAGVIVVSLGLANLLERVPGVFAPPAAWTRDTTRV